MEKLHFSILIEAPKEKVYDKMLGEETYKAWTEPFSKGSYYVGDWNKGSKILFLGPVGDGKTMGMVSRIKENRPNEFVSIEHLGMVEDGVEDTSSDKVKKWAGVLENYTFKQTNGKTELLIEMDSDEEYSEMFRETWPAALQKLKEISEQ
jgi:hypothetical protein